MTEYDCNISINNIRLFIDNIIYRNDLLIYKYRNNGNNDEKNKGSIRDDGKEDIIDDNKEDNCTNDVIQHASSNDIGMNLSLINTINILIIDLYKAYQALGEG